MKVLFQNRPDDLWIGGDAIQLHKTREALEKLGVETVFDSRISPDSSLYEGVDLVHLFNFSMMWTKGQFASALAHGKPVVCSMIYHETDKFVSWEEQSFMSEHMAQALFLTKEESARMFRHIGMDTRKVSYVPNGLDDFWFSAIKDPLESTDTFILSVGRVEPFKDQLTVARACRRLGLKHIVVGELRDSKYADMIRLLGSYLTGPVSNLEILKRFYASASCLALTSMNEVWPLVCDEAASQGTPLVMPFHCGREIPFAVRAKYRDVNEVANAIEKVLKRGRNEKAKRSLYRWSDVAQKVHHVYKKVLNER